MKILVLANLDTLEVIIQTLDLNKTQIVPTDNQMLFIEKLQDPGITKVIISMKEHSVYGYTHMHVLHTHKPTIWTRY